MVRNGNYAAVGNGDAVCVAAKVLDSVTELLKCFFYMRYPFFGVKLLNK